ncbi:DUF4349 domain-containing protein [Clostridium grantii]|uniref:DUF4349 domain-containing protein n=1 Tax=Clostridium grantii DSM 8605 TaxID=1121316 RepID=A0A1M5WLD1_9CLOT|nr:DUF4349 domain-containing protein [Clostridium grantii]SHH88319.1 protein of unknown function [Clostridium grantii DSM 8605]
MKNNKKIIIIIATLISIILILSACGAKNNFGTQNSMDYETNNKAKMDGSGFGKEFTNEISTEETAGTESPEADALINSNRKIIMNYYVSLETKMFDETNAKILERVAEVGGFVQNSQINGKALSYNYESEKRSGYYTLRVPKEKSDAFVKTLGDIGNVTTSTTSSEEVTDQYFDTEAHLKSLQIQEERLLELLKKSGELKDIIEIERELSDVRYQIESMTGTLRKLDNLVDYSTINIDVIEVQELSPETSTKFLEQVKDGFKNSIKSLYNLGKYLIITLVVLLPYLVVISILVIIGLKVRKKITNKKIEKINDKKE